MKAVQYDYASWDILENETLIAEVNFEMQQDAARLARLARQFAASDKLVDACRWLLDNILVPVEAHNDTTPADKSVFQQGIEMARDALDAVEGDE